MRDPHSRPANGSGCPRTGPRVVSLRGRAQQPQRAIGGQAVASPINGACQRPAGFLSGSSIRDRRTTPGSHGPIRSGPFSRAGGSRNSHAIQLSVTAAPACKPKGSRNPASLTVLAKGQPGSFQGRTSVAAVSGGYHGSVRLPPPTACIARTGPPRCHGAPCELVTSVPLPIDQIRPKGYRQICDPQRRLQDPVVFHVGFLRRQIRKRAAKDSLGYLGAGWAAV